MLTVPILFATIDLLAPSCYASSAWDYVGAAAYAVASIVSGVLFVLYGPGQI